MSRGERGQKEMLRVKDELNLLCVQVTGAEGPKKTPKERERERERERIEIFQFGQVTHPVCDGTYLIDVHGDAV